MPNQKIRPRRSMLYMPGANPRALDKARSLPADALIFDLEDAVLPDAKAAARDVIREAISAGGYGARELILRVNGLSTPWGRDDLSFAASLPVDGVLLPKVESPDMLADAAPLIGAQQALWCMIETPLGVLNAPQIAGFGDRLAGFVVGTNDLVKDLRARHVPGRQPLLTALGLILLAARAHGLVAIDGVHNALDDDAGFEDACRQGVAMGYDGKSLIHPRTIDAANRIFGPSPDDIAAARRLIDGFEAAKAEGQGVVRVDGRLVEQLHVDEARDLLAMAEAIRGLGS